MVVLVMIWLKSVGLFAGGLALGFSSGYFLAKKKYVEIKERQIEEMKKFGDVKEEYRRGSKDKENTNEDSEESREKGILSSETRSELKHLRYKSRPEDRVAYHKYPKERLEEGEEEVDPAEMESPEEISEVHIEHIDDPPELIDPEGLGDVPAWVESHSLIYYVEDDLLVEEENEVPVVDPYYHVGDILKTIDWETFDSDIVYIWNHGFDTLYEISLFNSME